MNYMTFIQGQNRKFADLQEELLECDQVLQEAEICETTKTFMIIILISQTDNRTFLIIIRNLY